MAGSVVPYAIDALYGALNGAISGVAVFDGPGATDERILTALWIGWNDPDDETFSNAASLDQSWPWLGHLQRAEQVTINCCVEAWNGNFTMKSARDQVFDVVTEIADLFQTDPSLGTVDTPIAGVNLLQVEGITSGTFYQDMNENGPRARLTFGVRISGRVS